MRWSIMGDLSSYGGKLLGFSNHQSFDGVQVANISVSIFLHYYLTFLFLPWTHEMLMAHD